MIGIMSDSHDNLTRVREAVRLFDDAGCDLVIHAGDFVAPFTALELKNLRCPVKAVFGNCDGEKAGLVRAFQGIGEVRQAPFELVHAGVRVVVTHLDSAVDGLLAAHRCDIIIYGHTHKMVVKTEGGILVVNPGETGGWLTGKSTVALLDPERKKAEIIPLG